jgi:hypothetical protein
MIKKNSSNQNSPPENLSENPTNVQQNCFSSLKNKLTLPIFLTALGTSLIVAGSVMTALAYSQNHQNGDQSSQEFLGPLFIATGVPTTVVSLLASNQEKFAKIFGLKTANSQTNSLNLAV